MVPDFLQFNLMDTYNRYFITFFDGTNTNNVYFRDFNMIRYQTSHFCGPYLSTLRTTTSPAVTNITGTAAVASSGGVLVDTTAPFATPAGVQLVYPGDIVHDVTHLDYGIRDGL